MGQLGKRDTRTLPVLMRLRISTDLSRLFGQGDIHRYTECSPTVRYEAVGR